MTRGGPAGTGRTRWRGLAAGGAIACLATVVLAAQCAGPAGPGTAGGDAPTATPRGTAPGTPARQASPRLTASQMAGQRVIYSYPGLTPPSGLLSLIRHGEVGGVVFFSGNIGSEGQIARVVAELDRANASRGNPLRRVPLLLMTDQEGGAVRRLPGAPLLSQMQIGESAHPAAAATAAGSGAGRNLAAVGMNVNLAPVLDVYRAPGGFDGEYGRSYSMRPQEVSSLGTDFITAQQAAGVAATAKHFPGLGAAAKAQNTDLRPVTLNVSLSDLRAVDEPPFRAAITAGVRLIMVSWAVYPALDGTRPAGLSPAVVNGELRQRLGFHGVTITDALEAGALQPFGGIGRRAVLAAAAGMDLLLCSGQSLGEGAQARAALADGYRRQTLDRSGFRAALQQIIALRTALAGHRL